MYSFNVVVFVFIVSTVICVIYTQDGNHQSPDQNSVCLCDNGPYVLNVSKLLKISLRGKVKVVHSNVDKITEIGESCNGIAAADLETIQVVNTNILSDIASIKKEMISRMNAFGDMQSKDKQNMDKLNEKIEDVHDVLKEIKDAIREIRNNVFSEITGIKKDITEINALGVVQRQSMENFKHSIGKKFKDTIKEIRSNVSAEIANVKNNNADLNNSGVAQTADTSVIPESCKELYRRGNRETGVYQIQPKSMTNQIKVSCDMETSGGGWTVIQKRLDGSQDFDLSWQEYKVGFGDIKREFWIGLENIYQMTRNEKNELLLELGYRDGKQFHAQYAEFSIGPESTRYNLTTLRGYSGNGRDSLISNKGLKFSTKDSGRTLNLNRHSGGWWLLDGPYSNFNGQYLTVSDFKKGTFWYGARQYDSLANTKMLIRPV